MNAFKMASAILILVFLLFVSAYVVVITRNITVSSSCWLFNWNPPPSTNDIPLALAYPETLIMSFPNGTLLMADMLLTFRGELAENTLVQIENASCQTPPEGIDVSNIVVGFEGAFLPNMTESIQEGQTWGGGAMCVLFSRSQSLPDGWSNFSVSWQNDVIFPVAGDYSPSIFVTFDDGSPSIQYTYSQIKVHVLSASEVNAENTNRIDVGLTFAILAFSFIEGFMVIYELLKKEQPKTQPSQAPTTTTPQIIRPPPAKNNPNNAVSTNDQPTCISDGENDKKESRSESSTKDNPNSTSDQP